ncbi:ABC transporter ATP-binding protein [Sporosarcina sp. G11-34]|uniref:ABC transporter ATP-binding protein n=1 Tax=Sporosarcina sp. G11-34 TaxID=2849605 RepID=UPI0022A9A64B|nr:ABC transporter ATP-binding protein [Sporosarcina sp. G11-34]MCZ2257662.1 ABC transporter ATP-binding protein [Sporosarcina sp. G11-34]
MGNQRRVITLDKIVDLKEVTKIYEGKVMHRAVNRLDFEAMEGEFVAVMGPSGSGKTTLLNLISTIDLPTYGRITINNIEPESLSQNDLALFRRRNLGFVFQDINLLQMLTVEENLVLPLTLDGVPLNEMEKRVAKVSQQLGLSDILDKRSDELSGGQAQRTAIGRALIHKPKIILADEPTGNLDSKSAKDVLELLSRINATERTTIIMVTHDPIAASYCDRVLFIKDGEFFNEIYKDERRQTFFQRILNVLSLLGGHHDLSSIRLP